MTAEKRVRFVSLPAAPGKRGLGCLSQSHVLCGRSHYLCRCIALTTAPNGAIYSVSLRPAAEGRATRRC